MKQGEEGEREKVRYLLHLVHSKKPPLELKGLPLSPQEVHLLVPLTS